MNTENSLIVSVCMTDTTHAPDPDLMCEAILFFADHLQNEDSTTHHISNISYQADPEQFFTLSTWVVNNMPYLLTDSDYLRFDTLLTEEYIQRQMKENRLLLLSPAGVALRDNITHDPLRLSAPIMQRLQDLQQNQGYELYDDFIFTHGKKEGIITVESNYPVSETHGNKSLLALIENISSTTSAHFNQQVTFHTFGAADISVTNAERIRKDSLLSVSIAVILILLVLAFSIRSLRGISLMFASLLFGWLFALGILGVFKSEVSFIAVGISSIIIGIAMNYPLHLILHYRNNGRIRNTLKDLVPPLTTGNITTMAAFLSLLLVNAPAMRDMGLFAALLLLGTILFVLFVLPHGLPSRMKQPIHEDNMTGFSHKKPVIIPQYIKKIVPLLLLAVTLVLLPFSSSTTFETDMHKINYMTDQQRQDMGRYMSQFELFSNLMPDEDEQSHRLVQWQSFMQKHDETFACASQAGTKAGFTENAFDPFFHILHQEYHVKETFNAGSLLKNMVLALADDFNKVLYFCGIIVFVFLCLTLGRLELGILAFLPLAIGWIWILGIMSIAGIHFNIVNIILATLIFGQGDDYTIFITEGLMQENASGKKVLKGYRKGIVLSAIIMFVGIGALITAKHPAMRSLAEVTLVGMSVVVVMAFIVPPLIYKWLTESGGTKRRTPVTLGNFLCSIFSMIGLMICSLWATIVGFYLFTLGKSTDAKKNWYHHFIYRGMRFFQKHIPHVTVKIRGMENLPSLENNPAIIICNHQSHLDLMCIMSLYPKLIILTKEWVSRSPLYGIVTQWADFYPINEGIETLLPKLQDKVKKGYSIMIFPEGTRSDDCKIGRFHSGAFHLAQQLNLDVLPVLIHGSGHVLPKKDFMLRKGEINVEVFPAVSVNDMQPLEVARSLRRFYQQEYVRISRQVETVNYFIDTVLQNYIYKGASVAHGSHAEYKRLLKEGKLQHIDLSPTECELDVEENGYGIYSLFFALVHKETMVTAMFADPDKASLLQYCAVKPENLRIEIAKP
ncbi:MAG: 1-acyl-sn-glycerol-3-phosphate acyltransferase [Bacteroidales bacterium]|nr:1-acyl-sn-glycerol-3-phosphate acyltransferase [Bacteroidales bacterium]